MKIVTDTNVKQLWNIGGDFGELKGIAQPTGQGYAYSNEEYQLTALIEKGVQGVYSRQDTLKNISGRTLTVHSVTSKFQFEGSEFEVYVQANGWVHESTGAWQKLTSGVQVQCESVRTCCGAAPFAVLWNCQTHRGIAFHLLADGAWRMNLTRVTAPGGISYAEVEMGLEDRDLALPLAPGEAFDLPEILYYEVRSQLDLDCAKLHHYCNHRWPRREMPVMFNSWLYLFSDLSVENIMPCIPVAQKIGCEYFVIDAGWFGRDPNWGASIGEWVENENAAFCGRMIEVAESVRAHSMKFGLWFEIERALKSAGPVLEHPDYFLEYEGTRFLDFANPEACAYMLDVLSAQINRYGIEFIKFDFNVDMLYDKYHSAFTKYYAGYRAFMKELRRRHPTVYFQNCASGGMRMNLTNLADFDSFWFSDNQAPYYGLEIIKNSMLRLPPQIIDRWACIQSVSGIRTYFKPDATKLISTNSSTWESITGIQESYLKGFLTGGPIGFSSDLTKLAPDAVEMLAEFVAEFKKNREFWMNASCRVLTDTKNVLTLQYSDEKLDKAVIVVFIKTIMQRKVQVFPVLDMAASYQLQDGSVMTASQIDEEGLWADVSANQNEGNNHARFFFLEKKG